MIDQIQTTPIPPPVSSQALGRYVDREGRPREIVALDGARESLLVVDRDARTLGDGRLVAHLSAEEPASNAALVCAEYLREGRPCRCRRLTEEDLRTGPFERDLPPERGPLDVEVCDGEGRVHRLEPLGSGTSIPELRWCAYPLDGEEGDPEPVSVRALVASLESYDPVCALTAQALACPREDPLVSTSALRTELERLEASRIVLNRGLREAVLAAVRTGVASMSEIAMRCGRVKYDSRGNPSGETSWLARRVGLLSESRGGGPTPWVHTDVLALIARHGLGLSPREVELG
ncbi:MAG TPA: hypothetical protein VGX16_08230 [Solirubrobacteraceae bacterium]|jgi:hypothetical protein|nr:hypothetical protein [Solirubrobacteraceae bacterium]